MELPKQRGIFLPGKAKFRGNHWFISRKFNAVWQKKRR